MQKLTRPRQAIVNQRAMLSKHGEEKENPPGAVFLRWDRILTSPANVNESTALVSTCCTASTTYRADGMVGDRDV